MSIEDLCREYEKWNRDQGLKLGSADEHLHDETLTELQRAWLKRFCERWEAAVDEERAYAEAEHEAFGECDHEWDETEEDFYVCKRCNERSTL